MSDQDLADVVRAIIDANLYMVLGTADEGGRPWVSPVYYVSDRYTEFYWVSSPEVTHSRNIARRPEMSIVVFDSQVQPGSGQAVYMSAVAEEVSGSDIDRGIDIYSRGAVARAAWEWKAEQVRPPARYRLYRATVTQHSILCPRSRGQPCAIHGLAHDHRAEVTLESV
jgi:nitroimidazol reductase NimA-like FMN-containing flavoprotein (pyridoxamine 5'-phosphate oxidase superfamily)